MPQPDGSVLRQLGSTDMKLTRVGLGTWAIGGPWAFGWGPQDDADSITTIHHAVEAGVNWLDTAAVYGLGHSEEVVGRAIGQLAESERPYIFTKCGMLWDESDRSLPPTTTARPDTIRREVEDSLRRLRVERIDLYQVHWPPDDDTPIEEYWGAMEELKQAGKVRAIGLSNHTVAHLERAEAGAHVDSLQPPFSAINRAAAAELIPWCRSHGAGVIAYSPMQSGLLTGAFSAERAASLAADDWRKGNPDFNGDGLRRNLKVAAAMATVAERRDVSTAAVAVAWALSWPGVTGAIVGARRPDQVDGFLTAMSLDLNEADLVAIDHAIATSGAGAGPRRPTER